MSENVNGNVIPTSIEIFLPSFTTAGGEELGRETRCFPGTDYYVAYKLTPGGALPSNWNGEDMRVFTEIVEGDSLIESWGQYQKSGSVNNGRPQVVFKSSDVSGSVKLRLCVEDLGTGNVIRSNDLALEVIPRHGTISDEDLFWDKYSNTMPSVNTAEIVLHEGETFNCIDRIYINKHNRYPNLHKGISRYFYVYPTSYLPKEGDPKPADYTSGTINSSNYFSVDPDGTTIVPKKAGAGKVSLSWKVETANAGWSTSSSSISVIVIDAAEALADTMNLRFKISKIEIDRSARIFYSYLRNSELLEGTKYTWPYESEDGERDKRLQLLEKYQTTNYEDLLLYDDPNGVFDSSRLKMWFENSAGEKILNTSSTDAGVLCDWQEGTIYLVAEYGSLESSKAKTHVRIPYTVVTSNASYVPIRDIFNGFGTAHADEMDFSEWYPISKIIDITPSDATINVSDFSISSNIGSDFIFVERIGTEGTIDEQYRVRISGIGHVNAMSVTSYTNSGIHSFGGGIYTVGLPSWDGYRYLAAYAPNSATLSSSKSTIRKGECVFVSLQFSPNEEYTLNSSGTIYTYFQYRSGTSGEWMTAKEMNDSGFAEVVCASRKGVIIIGRQAGTLGIRYGNKRVTSGSSVNIVDNYIDISISNEDYAAPTGTLRINASRNLDGTVQNNQTLTLSGGTTVVGWNSSSWRYASITSSGYLQTYTSGNVVIYAVTADGRLATETFSTKSTSDTEPVQPEPETPINTELREAQDTSDDIILSFDTGEGVSFDSPDSDPIEIGIHKESHNFDLRDVVCISENPGVATAQAFYNMSNGNMGVTITPVGKGNTVIRIVCGGAEDSLSVSVLGGTVPATPKLQYSGVYGASLNIYEFTELEFKADSMETFDAIDVTTSNEKIEWLGGGYNRSTGIGYIKVALKDHVSGYVYVKYGTEKLIFSIANRFNLKFENINDFSLGIGASRSIKIYPLDDTVKASSVQVYSERNNVFTSEVTDGGIEPETGKRFFLVEVKYYKAGRDILVAHRKGDDDIYLDFNCEATTIPAQSISFNINSITLNK